MSFLSYNVLKKEEKGGKSIPVFFHNYLIILLLYFKIAKLRHKFNLH